ncbi:homocysteine S-methyltransferase family protein [Pelagibacteraceae bacterium]|nr:homocysteine S-methyltransferase family protein [Pelagibacteraceae bacterium]
MFQKNKKYLLDGGSGQTLMEMGLNTTGDLWSAKALIDNNNHSMVLNMHNEFIRAGAELIVTTNFSVRRRLLKKYNLLSELKPAIEAAGKIALKAKNETNKKVLVAGALPNQGNTYSPIQFETDDTIYKNFLEVAQILNDYVDIFYLDVLCSIKEIELALEATKNFNKKVLVGAHLRFDANLPSGETIDDLIVLVKKYNCCGIIAACVSPEIVELSIPKLNKQKLHFGFKVNLFRELPTSTKDNFHNKGFDGDAVYEDPADLLGTRKDEFLDKKFKSFILNTLNEGTTLIGGCCEVKPRHINLLKDIF